MKRKIIGIIVFLVVAVFVCSGYVRVNRQFPQSSRTVVKAGESTLYQEGISIKILSSGFLADENAKVLNEQVGDILSDAKIIKVTLDLRNVTDTEQKVDLTSLNLQSLGMTNGISKNIIDVSNGAYSSTQQTIPANSDIQITVPYQIWSMWFRQSDWNKIEKRTFWLKFSAYPEDIRMLL